VSLNAFLLRSLVGFKSIVRELEEVPSPSLANGKGPRQDLDCQLVHVGGVISRQPLEPCTSFPEK